MAKRLLYRMLAVIIGFLFCGPGYGNAPADIKTDITPVKNVILLIGDGMGINAIKKAESDLGIELTVFNEFPLRGESKTATLGGIITDSAAGGTALATGVKTAKECVGVYPNDIDAKKSYPMNLTELAISQGKSTGILTTGSLYDATPAAFSAHQGYRLDYQEIQKQQIEGKVDLIWGAWNHNKYRENGRALAEQTEGLRVLWDYDEINSFNGDSRSIAIINQADELSQTNPKHKANLSFLLTKALPILNRNENGFFLMAESDHIDSKAEDGDTEAFDDAVLEFSKTVQLALDFAKEDGNTMVIVTADHETGGITKLGSEYVFLSNTHTYTNVPVFVYGCDSFMKNGEVMQNCEVGRRIANAMGELDFPRRITVE